MKNRVIALLVMAALLAGVPVSAQTFIRLQTDLKKDGSLSPTSASVEMTDQKVGGFGSVKVQAKDSYTGVWEVRCSPDGSSAGYEPNPLKLTAINSSTVVTSVTNTVGTYDVLNAAGCKAIKVVATSGFAATDTAIVISATQSGGGSGGASGGGGGGGGDVNLTGINGVTPAVGAGVVNTGTPRVTLGSDDPAVSLLTTIESNTNSAAATLDSIESRLGVEVARDTTPTTDSGSWQMLKFYDFDGAAFTVQSTTEGFAVQSIASAYGVQYIMPVTENGAKTPIKELDVAYAAGDAGFPAFCLRDDTLNIRSAAEDRWEPCHTNANGAQWVIDVNSAALLTSAQLIDDSVFTDEGGFTYTTSKVLATGYVAESTTDAIADGLIGAPIMTLGRVAYSAAAATADGGQAVSECILVSAASTNATNCKNAAGNFYGIDMVNTTTTLYYLRMYNTSSSPTCSSATGFIRSIPIPPAGAAGQAGGIVRIAPIGVNYGTGISFCVTGGSSSTDNTNAATGIFGTVLYK